jgi:methylated-DNA-[protein]-cysteine S-methyltransferase
MADVLRFLVDRLATPIGDMMIVADESGRLRALGWNEPDGYVERRLAACHGPRGFSMAPTRDPFGLTSALSSYLRGDLAAIDALEVEMPGTPFQRSVWKSLRTIPAGATASYGEIARRIGQPTAVRAVGLANRSNPVAIVVPCHRVIGADGSLTGYGGGLERKRWLLAHEAEAASGTLFRPHRAAAERA